MWRCSSFSSEKCVQGQVQRFEFHTCPGKRVDKEADPQKHSGSLYYRILPYRSETNLDKTGFWLTSHVRKQGAQNKMTGWWRHIKLPLCNTEAKEEARWEVWLDLGGDRQIWCVLWCIVELRSLQYKLLNYSMKYSIRRQQLVGWLRVYRNGLT